SSSEDQVRIWRSTAIVTRYIRPIDPQKQIVYIPMRNFNEWQCVGNPKEVSMTIMSILIALVLQKASINGLDLLIPTRLDQTRINSSCIHKEICKTCWCDENFTTTS
nr:hypothetical protein [Tanacetum cinerariifolium]